MKSVKLPNDLSGDLTAIVLLEDAVMSRAAWRSGHGPKLASIVFSAFDAAAASGGVLVLADAAFTMLVEQSYLEPGQVIQPRAANRAYLRVMRALQEAEEVVEVVPP